MPLHLKIQGMDCADEVAVLKREIGPLVGGVLTANMLGPMIRAQAPESWHSSLFFLAGWGGLELVAKCYDLGVCALERYVNRNTDPSNGA